jgi:hypothetical protein
VQIALPDGEPITAIEWTWFGPGTWNLRGSTLETVDGDQIQLMLQPGLEEVDFSPVKVYERVLDSSEAGGLRPLLPRAEVLDDESALAMLASAPDADRRLALAPGSELPTGEPAEEAAALFRRVNGPPERLRYERIEGEGAGYLLIDDGWSPGWRAEVDGHPVPLYRANVHFKTVWVPSSGQTVTLIYEPSSVRLGALISVGAILLAVGLLVLGRPQGRTS